MAPMLHKRGNHAAVQLAGHVYVMGGGQMGLHYKHAEKCGPPVLYCQHLTDVMEGPLLPVMHTRCQGDRNILQKH